MTPATVSKATAIAAALERDHPAQHFTPSNLLAMLTSPVKTEREDAKRMVRDLVRTGTGILQAAQDAADLASFANRHEP
ncbi:MAG: hypothetical protein Q7T21_02880 [Gallionella sp.]|nr:hypothetical protein [Gallionella sp.]